MPPEVKKAKPLGDVSSYFAEIHLKPPEAS